MTKPYKTTGLIVLATLLAAFGSPASAQQTSVTDKSIVNPTLTVHPGNRRYFMLGNTCEAIYLAGTHHSANLQDFLPATFDFENQYPPGNQPGAANFIRGWHWEGSSYSPSSIWPLALKRTGPGNANDGQLRFNLTQYDDLNYVQRLSARISDAYSEGMLMSIMLFQGWSVDNVGSVNPWPDHPFRSGNNVNNINGDWDQTSAFPDGRELHSRIATKPPLVTQYQDNYVRHIVEMLNSHENILWEVSNESYQGSLPWQQYIADVIRSKEATLGKRHLVWISAPRISPSATAVSNKNVYSSTADVISPTWQKPAVKADGTEVSGSAMPGDIYQTNPPATSGRKIVILDTDHIGAPCDWCSRVWVWRAFIRGYHVALLEDDPTYESKKALVRQGIKQTLQYSKKVRLVAMAPQNESQATPYCSTGYCLYSSDNPDPQADANNDTFVQAVANGKEYLVLKPDNVTSQVTIYGLPAGDYGGEWLNLGTGSVSPLAFTRATAGNHILTSPFVTTPAVLLLQRKGITFTCS